MIVEWFFDLCAAFAEWVLSLFDGFTVPGAIKSPSGTFGQLVGNVYAMGVWVPWGVVAGAVFAALSVWGIMFVVKIVRQIVAHVPLFGGAG